MVSGEKTICRLAAMGDVMLAREVGRHIVDRPEDFSFADIRPVLQEHDLIFLNLENPAGTRGTPHGIQDPHVTFCCHPDALRLLTHLGVTVASLGNNHMLDYGDTALLETIENLDALGIRHAGAGRNYEEANRPLLMTCKGKRIAFLSYVFIYSASTGRATKRKPGVSDYRIGRILPVIRELNLSGYQIIVSIHWGLEYSFYPLPYQMKQARRMIDSGASMILGHGPHYPQGIETYNGGQIVYSLGNFIFDEPYKYANRSFIYSVGVAGNNRLQDARIFPVHLSHHVPALVYGKEEERLKSLIHSLGRVYPKKSKVFWQNINNLYFSDIVSRVFRMKSLKFVFLPPASFYDGVGLRNYGNKFKPRNLAPVMRSSLKRVLQPFKKAFLTLVPLELRKRLAIWLNRKRWGSSGYSSTEGVVGDLMRGNPKAFHKFMWANHMRAYATWYDSAALFHSNKMNGSEIMCREFFKDLRELMGELGLDVAGGIRSVFEVGCSLGYLLHFIEKNVFPNAGELVGIDIDGEAIDKGRRYLHSSGSNVNLICGDMEYLGRLVGDRHFDFVFAAGVLSYLNEEDAARVVADMLGRTDKILALVGLACASGDNRELDTSHLSPENRNQWIHNFEAMVAAAGGRVVRRRWEGTDVHNRQPLYFVFATGPRGAV
jgi:poly-gamma-glutamate capsule biosynthesis protein CapA/YwtB (metallophosphatase superfamily)/SAM-dependent methyltransferase